MDGIAITDSLTSEVGGWIHVYYETSSLGNASLGGVGLGRWAEAGEKRDITRCCVLNNPAELEKNGLFQFSEPVRLNWNSTFFLVQLE